MKIVPCVQGEPEWFAARIGKVTASEIHNLITPHWKIRTGDTPKTYLYHKVAEAWRGSVLPGFSSWSTDQGAEREIEARRWYSLEFDEKMVNVGFIEGDDGRCGCSPDSLIEPNGGLEIKSPESVNHLRWLMDGKIPDDHVAQVYMSLYVTGRDWWRFISYHSRFPKLVVTVGPDEKIFKQIEGALAGFYLAFDQTMTRLKELAA